MVHVPLKSDAVAGLELATGRIQLGFQTLSSALPLARGRKIRILAHTQADGLPVISGVPSLGDAGAKGLDALDPFKFFGIVGPKGLPSGVVERLNGAIGVSVASPAMIERLRAAQLTPAPGSAAGFQAYMKAQFGQWGEIGRSAGFSD